MPFSVALDRVLSRPMGEGVPYAFTFGRRRPQTAVVKIENGLLLMQQSPSEWLSLGRLPG